MIREIVHDYFKPFMVKNSPCKKNNSQQKENAPTFQKNSHEAPKIFVWWFKKVLHIL